MLILLALVPEVNLGMALTLEAVDQNLGRVAGGGHRAVESALSLIRVTGRGVQSQTLDASRPHAPSAAASPKATTATHRLLLLERVTPLGQLLLGSDGCLIVTRVKTTNAGGALHGAPSSCPPVAAVNNRAAALAGVPLLSKATSWLEIVVVVLLAAASAVDRGVIGVVVVVGGSVVCCVGLLLWEMRVGGGAI